MSFLRLRSEVVKMRKDLCNRFDSQILSITELTIDDANFDLMVIVKPNAGIYKDCRVTFQIVVYDVANKAYHALKKWRMHFFCHTILFHPNIEIAKGKSKANVCIDMGHNPGTLEDGIISILYIMHNPYIDEPLLKYFHNIVQTKDELHKLVEITKIGYQAANLKQDEDEETMALIGKLNQYYSGTLWTTIYRKSSN